MSNENYCSYYPDRMLPYLPDDANVHPLRGYGYTMGVTDKDGKPIGCIAVELIGYKTVKEWMKKNQKKENDNV